MRSSVVMALARAASAWNVANESGVGGLQELVVILWAKARTTRAGSDCSAVVSPRGGTLQAAGVLSHTSPRSEWAITGGTGRYAGARGTAELRQASPTRTKAVITLLR